MLGKVPPLYSGTLKQVTSKYVLKSVTSEGKGDVGGCGSEASSSCLLEDGVRGLAHRVIHSGLLAVPGNGDTLPSYLC